jgi:hypothetical protein
MLCLDVNNAAVNTVDIFNATNGTWSTAALSVARQFLAATSLPNHGLAIFAGGCGSYCLFMSVIGGVGVVGWGRDVCGAATDCCCVVQISIL